MIPGHLRAVKSTPDSFSLYVNECAAAQGSIVKPHRKNAAVANFIAFAPLHVCLQAVGPTAPAIEDYSAGRDFGF